jgi:DNA replication protein DnaC
MLNNATIDKLLSMRFSAMADAFRIQQDDPSMKELDFDERFGLLVDAEYSRRKSNRLKRLIKDAGFEEKDACIAGIDYQQDRSLNRQLISRLATCDYITEYRNIFITGKSGSGKTYLACAFGMAACMKYYKVKFVRFSDLLIRLKEAEDENKYVKVLKEYVNPRVLILDEWLLNPITNEEARYVLDLIHKRRKKSSTIFCSQYEDTGWYAQLGGDETPLADSIMDRIAYDSYKINIRAKDPTKDRSMREVYGIRPDERE